MANNIFEFIKGYENLYMINKLGEIRSLKVNSIKKHQITDDGYSYVHLTKPDIEGNKIRSKCRIHRLLALQYIENPNNYPEVDHIDRNKQNNTIENLRWVSRVENRNNREDILENLSDEQIKERNDELKEYKRLWAEKNRREKGMKIKTDMTKTKDPEYKNNWRHNMIETETEEHKAERLRKRREAYAKKEQTEEQKEKAKERARKQREAKKLLRII